MNDRDRFLQALAKNEDDTATRLVYADWLDERGEHEEADRQRKWPAAKEWLVKLCDKYNPPDAYYTKITYEELITRGLLAVHDADNSKTAGIGFNDNERMCYAIMDNREEFWKNWSVITGVAAPMELQEKISFHCGC
jgi:uncharacterized protein (TIGR02996 family)